MNDCPVCIAIDEVEKRLDEEARVLTERELAFRWPARQRNNVRWIRFAGFCRIPVLGRIIQRLLVMPRSLESEPSPRNEPWYKEAHKRILHEAHTLEDRKDAHLIHYGNDIVSPDGTGDPAGYYTPDSAPRSECVKRGYYSGIPRKFDFWSMAGVHKTHVGRLVMCSVTRRIAEENDCDWCADARGIRYWARSFSIPDPSVLGFNEWRHHDARVTNAMNRSARRFPSGIHWF